jgi:geranylgeranyl diphosphate synthase type II
MSRSIVSYLEQFNKYLETQKFTKNPVNLYEPIDYILQLGGKRIRPCMALLFAEAFGKTIEETLPLAHSIEIFHNFTLVHDDIMDNAPLRRGKTTIHEKWDVNTAILSGDSMMIIAYNELLKLDTTDFKGLLSYFNSSALKVCEGQQKDMDFEQEQVVSLNEYLNMIENKTAVLLAASMKLGAMFAGVEKKVQDDIELYGTKIGIAFQLRDDYLDTFGDDEVGKKIGGDILANKKTALYLYALEKSSETDCKRLLDLYAETNGSQEKIDEVISIFKKYKADEFINSMAEQLVDESDVLVKSLQIDSEYQEILLDLNKSIISRSF